MTTDANDREWLAPKQVAAELRVSTSSVYKAIARGSLPAFRLTEDGALRIPRGALKARRRQERDG
jgi:excisionase family DNA binding protein